MKNTHTSEGERFPSLTSKMLDSGDGLLFDDVDPFVFIVGLAGWLRRQNSLSRLFDFNWYIGETRDRTDERRRAAG